MALIDDGAMIKILWQRHLFHFIRQPSRLLAALLQPFLLWWLLGHGMGHAFRLPGSTIGYVEYFFPGMLLLVALLSSMFASAGLIDDQEQGFLQLLLVAPAGRLALLWGRSLGAASVALFQALCFLVLLPFAGFDMMQIDIMGLVFMLLLVCLWLSVLHFLMAVYFEQSAYYYAAQSMVSLPLWLISGAVYPVSQSHGFLYWLDLCNPLTYALYGLRASLYGGSPPYALMPVSLALHSVVMLLMALLMTTWLAYCLCLRRSW